MELVTNEKRTFKSWMKGNWKKVAFVAGIIGTTAVCYVISKNSTDQINCVRCVDLIKPNPHWLDAYIDANFTKDDLLEDPAALLILGEEVISDDIISVEQANDILHLYAVQSN